jgi:holin-like protein
MIKGFAILLAFQLAGELLVMLLRLPISGPICGMALLLYWLNQTDTEASKDLTGAADGLLANMAILFVPIGVGVMVYWPLLRQDWLAISLALVVSTVLSVAVTAWVVGWLKQPRKQRRISNAPAAAFPSQIVAR